MVEKSPTVATAMSFEVAMAAGKELLFNDQQMSSRIVASERYFRRALELAPQSTDAMSHLAWALESQGRMTESKDWYERVLAIEPASEVARERYPMARRALGMHLDQDRERFTRFPETLAELSDLETAVWRYCLSHVKSGQLAITPATRVVTLGSCFAANLAHALNAEGIDAHNLNIAEFFNSTYANLELIEFLLGYASSASDLHLRNFGGGAEETAKLLKQADLIVYTVGVAGCFFEAATGKFVMPERGEAVLGAVRGKYIFRTTSVDENYRNLRKIVSHVHDQNPNCRLVFTLSPVPLAATLENRSAMEADCLSKATLRVAVEQLVQSVPDCVYWPSFEIVRWLGAYVPGMYGEEDGSPRHVSERVVRLVVRAFLQLYGAAPEPAETAPIKQAEVAGHPTGSVR
jgi:tetratricopeptide (TPR) repeat protein